MDNSLFIQDANKLADHTQVVGIFMRQFDRGELLIQRFQLNLFIHETVFDRLLP